MNKIDELEYIRDNFSTLQRDYQKYAAVNLVIKTKDGVLVRLLFNRMQKYLWKCFLEDIAAKRPLRWLVIKGRQMGLTTWFLGLIYWLETMHTNTNSLLLAHDEDAAISLGVKVQYLHGRGKQQLKPETRTTNRKQIHFASSLEKMQKTGEIGLDSIIDISTGDSEGIGISRTYQYVLITEFATMCNLFDVESMLTKLSQCVAKIPGTGIFMDTTSEGENYCKDFWEDDKNGYRKIFISWVAEDEYRVDLPVGRYFELSSDPNSAYGDEVEEQENIKFELRKWYEEFQNNSPSNYLIDHESYCRLAWRRNKLDEDFFGDYSERKASFYQQYPTTVWQAFTGKNKSIFSIPRLITREEEIKHEEIKPTMYEFDHFEKKFGESKYGKLRVFEPPQQGQRYVIGGDASQGIEGGDDSALVVLKLPSLTEVASFNDIISPSEYATIAYHLGLLYNRALLAIELNDKGGYAAIQFLRDGITDTNGRKVSYPNLFYMPDQNPSNIRYGWVTNGITKSIMISDTKDLIYQSGTVINSKGGSDSPGLLDQLKVYVETKPNVFGAIPGKHDDLAMAFMIAIQAAKSIHIPRQIERPKKAPKGSPDYLIAQMSMRQKMRARFGR